MTKNNINLEEILQTFSLVKQSKYNGGNPTTGEGFNKTSLFILPMFGLNYKERPLSPFLRNAFLDDCNIEHDMKNCIFILLKCPTYWDKNWKNITIILDKHKQYITDYYIGREDNCDLHMYVLQVPEIHKEDLIHFKNSRYSLMSEKYKKLFPQFIYRSSGDKVESQLYGALYKTSNIKDKVVKEFTNPKTSTAEDVISLRRDMDNWDECWDSININEETYGEKNKQ